MVASLITLLTGLNIIKSVYAQEKIIINPTSWASLTDLYPDQTSDTLSEIKLSYNTGDHSEYLTLMDFDFSNIPQDAEITKAVLTLTQKESSDELTVNLTFKRIRRSWKLNTVTWNTLPETVGNSYTVTPVQQNEKESTYLMFGITKLTQEWLTNTKETNGIQIKGPNYFSYHKSYYAEGDNQPTLKIEYVVPSEAPASVQDNTEATTNIQDESTNTISTQNNTKTPSVTNSTQVNEASSEKIQPPKNVIYFVFGIIFIFAILVMLANHKIRTILLLIVLSFILLITIFFVTAKQIGTSVNKRCIEAENSYGGTCVEALIQLVDDPNNSFSNRNHAIWALGQLGDSNALPVLKKYYTGVIPKKEPYDSGISQYELKKAINLLEGGYNISAFIWR